MTFQKTKPNNNNNNKKLFNFHSRSCKNTIQKLHKLTLTNKNLTRIFFRIDYSSFSQEVTVVSSAIVSDGGGGWIYGGRMISLCVEKKENRIERTDVLTDECSQSIDRLIDLEHIEFPR